MNVLMYACIRVSVCMHVCNTYFVCLPFVPDWDERARDECTSGCAAGKA